MVDKNRLAETNHPEKKFIVKKNGKKKRLSAYNLKRNQEFALKQAKRARID
jgi:hypothetical protein